MADRVATTVYWTFVTLAVVGVCGWFLEIVFSVFRYLPSPAFYQTYGAVLPWGVVLSSFLGLAVIERTYPAAVRLYKLRSSRVDGDLEEDASDRDTASQVWHSLGGFVVGVFCCSSLVTNVVLPSTVFLHSKPVEFEFTVSKKGNSRGYGRFLNFDDYFSGFSSIRAKKVRRDLWEDLDVGDRVKVTGMGNWFGVLNYDLIKL